MTRSFLSKTKELQWREGVNCQDSEGGGNSRVMDRCTCHSVTCVPAEHVSMGITCEAKMRLCGLRVLMLDGKAHSGVPLVFTATIILLLVAYIIANPFDVVKSRMQQDATGK